METVERVQVADVVFGAREGGAQAEYTYRSEKSLPSGELVLAPLGNRTLLGLVLRVYESSEQELGFPIAKLRPVTALSPPVRLPPELVSVARFVAEGYLCPISAAIGAGLPPAAGDRLSTTWMLHEERLAAGSGLTSLQADLVEEARSFKGRWGAFRALTSSKRKAIMLLEAKGILESRISLEVAKSRGPGVLYRITSDEARVDEFLREHAQKRPAQALTVLRLRESESSALSMGDITALGGTTQAVVKSLADSGLLETVAPDVKTPAKAPTPNAEQVQAIEAICEAISAKRPQGFLLFGVTGSGKTEVYLRAAAEALRQGRQVLYLVPEIALATQAIGQLRERFGSSVAVLHSELSPAERLDNWLRVSKGLAPIVIGARSASFAPLSNVGLIVMDEEHEASYKQESTPRYHAKALVRLLAGLHRCPYVLGSATPSIESFYEAEAGQLRLLELRARAASAQLPEVEVEDLGFGFRSGRPALLSERLETLLAETVNAGRQAILFLNRRAYAPFLVCRECGHFFMCPRCAVTLTYSRKSVRLRCHHCGHQERPPDTCPKCKGSRLNPVGVGTEKVEEAVRALLPEASVERLDRDVAQRKGALESVLARFGAGEIDVLVGTQIVAKGLNFPNVTLVGVVAADVSLNLPDFRASERTYQLLSQVAGRAGRGASPGRVVIQTFNPSHIAVQAARSHDYRHFYQATLSERRDALYPPFRRLVNVVFSGSDYAAVVHVAERAGHELRRNLPAATILGPAQCVFERLQNRWRWHLLAKCEDDSEIQTLHQTIEGLDLGKVQALEDVDAYSLM